MVYSVYIMLFFQYVNVKWNSEYQASPRGEGPGDKAIYQYANAKTKLSDLVLYITHTVCHTPYWLSASWSVVSLPYQT